MVGGQPSGKVVLVVDDEDDIRESVAELIRAKIPGARVITAKSGEEGLRLLKTDPARVIVADYKMDGIDGIEFLKRSRLIVPKASRLMMSAYAETSLALEALKEADVALLVTKPFQLDYFVQLIGTLLKRR